jgi:hypothetical protein
LGDEGGKKGDYREASELRRKGNQRKKIEGFGIILVVCMCILLAFFFLGSFLILFCFAAVVLDIRKGR